MIAAMSFVGHKENPPMPEKKADWTVLLLLSIILGTLGIHRFYVGKIGTGILMLLTGGGCGIWALYDIIMIVLEKFTDAQGQIVTKN
jgi:TM2 domain-containing membrane protein YozV